MKRMTPIVRLLTVIAGVISLGLAITSAASASTVTSAKATTYTIAVSAPSGCNSGNYCSYNQGNGGSLCFQTHINQNWPSGCANKNDSGYNRNGNAVNLYWGPSYQDAYYTLYSGHYLLYMTQNTFNQCSTCFGYGQQLADNVMSSAFL